MTSALPQRLELSDEQVPPLTKRETLAEDPGLCLATSAICRRIGWVDNLPTNDAR